ncbi:MAG: flavin reductase [Erysipelotrichales bacterium]|nr:flavin reductase [Erysipelotrichales bacterium]
MIKKTLNEVILNPIKLFRDDYGLLTARKKDKKFNTMTVSWGTIGHLWNEPIVEVYVRPQRFTFEFNEEDEYFSLSFFDGDFKDALSLLGRKSGRDGDKIKETALLPIEIEDAITFKQAKLVVVAQKIYADYFKEELFIERKVLKNYPDKDYHKRYIGKIVAVYEA